jgi:transposase
VHILHNTVNVEIENSIKGFKSLYGKLRKIYKKEIDRIVFIYEPTGSYSEQLKRYCSKQQIRCFIITPKQFHNYAKALGVEIKNDAVDAKVLAQSLHLAKEGQVKVPEYNEDAQLIKELMGYYKFTVKQTTRHKNHLESLSAKEGSTFAIAEIKKTIKDLKAKEQKIIEELYTLIQNNKEYKASYQSISSVPGVGKIGTIALLHMFLRYPKANQREITSLAGLNPIYRQSGSSLQSSYRISKSGSKLYRGSLFMGVFSAIKYDQKFADFYERLKANGKHTTQAHTAVLRKMILIAHSLYMNQSIYDAEYQREN